MKNIKTLAVIPARGGSKRLSRKNIIELRSKPLIYYTINAAKKCRFITDLILSSEDDEIIRVAKKYGIEVPFKRPKSLSGDKVRNIEVVQHALNFMEKKKNIKYDNLVLLQPTCPIRKSEHIDHAIKCLSNSKLNSAVSVKGPFKKRDPILKKIVNEVIVPYSKKDISFYIYNASIYAVKTKYFKKYKKFVSNKQIPIIMDKFHSIDIDDIFDLKLAEVAIRFLKK
ncbi:MAG: cytidylyltransferase domain-containing protein [Alphaproteobacteria bacterium]